MTKRKRAGHSLVELLATLATLGALLAVAGGLFRLASRTALVAADRAEALDATRTAAALIDRELRPLGAADFAVFPDSIGLRAFRGYAIPCDTAGGTVSVRYAGARPPDPAKDSIIARSDTIELAAALTSAARVAPIGACAPIGGEQVVALTTSTPLPAAAVWLVYERGTYSIGTGALRYRRGLGGRQPVTAPSFMDVASGFAADSAPPALELILAPAHARVNSFALPVAVRVPLPNADTTVSP